MPLVEWNYKFNTNIIIVDYQHKNLVAMVNELYEAINDKQEDLILKDIMYRLIDYTKVHFKTEEQHMFENNYPKLEQHKTEHQSLIKTLIRLLENMKADQSNVSSNLLEILKNWLQEHILKMDIEYGDFIKNKKSKV